MQRSSRGFAQRTQQSFFSRRGDDQDPGGAPGGQLIADAGQLLHGVSLPRVPGAEVDGDHGASGLPAIPGQAIDHCPAGRPFLRGHGVTIGQIVRIGAHVPHHVQVPLDLVPGIGTHGYVDGVEGIVIEVVEGGRRGSHDHGGARKPGDEVAGQGVGNRVENDGEVDGIAHEADKGPDVTGPPAETGFVEQQDLVHVRIVPGHGVQVGADHQGEVRGGKPHPQRVDRGGGQQEIAELIVLPDDQDPADAIGIHLAGRRAAMAQGMAGQPFEHPGLEPLLDRIPHHRPSVNPRPVPGPGTAGCRASGTGRLPGSATRGLRPGRSGRRRPRPPGPPSAPLTGDGR